MENTAALTNILEYFWGGCSRLDQHYQTAHLLLARNSECIPKVGVGKLMTLIKIQRLSSTSRDGLSS